MAVVVIVINLKAQVVSGMTSRWRESGLLVHSCCCSWRLIGDLRLLNVMPQREHEVAQLAQALRYKP
jgi:hypothetical protein